MALQTEKPTASNSSSTNKNPNARFPRKNQKPMQGTSSFPKKENKQSRNEKRRRWAKKNKPVAKPVVKRGPVKEYITACCNVTARKPQAGDKIATKNPESGKTESTVKGLGHWRCSACGKPAKVSPRKPESKETVVPEVTNAG